MSYDTFTPEEVLEMLFIRHPGRPFAAVVTPNADHLVRIGKSDGRIASAYEDAWLCLNDSRVVEILARTLGQKVPAVPGADLVRDLFHSPAFDRRSPILLVGGSTRTFDKLVERFGLEQATHYDAPMGLMHDRQAFDATVSFVEQHPARFTFIAVGSPQQELLAWTLAKRGKARGIGLCIGASIEFLVEPHRRAPRWMSRMGLEWLFRLMSEPRRLWRRYLVDSPQLLRLYLKERQKQKGRHS